MILLATWALLNLAGLISPPFTQAASLQNQQRQLSGNRLRRRNGQIPMWHGIPGGGEQPDADELLAHTRILQVNQSASTSAIENSTTKITIVNDPGSISETPIKLATYQPKTNSSLRFIRNSGVCETRPGVQTYSGYIPINQNQSMFFWLFEAR